MSDLDRTAGARPNNAHPQLVISVYRDGELIITKTRRLCGLINRFDLVVK